MVLTVKIQKKDAERLKKFLFKYKLFDNQFQVSKDKEFIYFPIKSKDKINIKFPNASFGNKKLKKYSQNITLKSALKGKLAGKELKHLKTAYDLIGDIAILEIDKELKDKEKLIAETLLNTNDKVKTVLKKSGIHYGVFRTQKLKHLAGKKTKEATYKENNITLKLNVEEVYFSPRLSAERKRIYKLVKPREDILVMFSGCAPYPVVLSKNTKAKEIIGIEINQEGHKYALENVKLNKLSNIKLYLGDVRKVVPKLKQKFDRILMPLPKSAEDFLPEAFMVSKKGTIIHLYDFLDENEFDNAKQKIKNTCKKANLKCKILKLTKCGQHAPHVYRICIDFKIL